MAWRHVLNWPTQLTAIHAVLLRNNRLVMWGFGEPNSSLDCKAGAKNVVDRAVNLEELPSVQIHYPRHAMLPDGRAPMNHARRDHTLVALPNGRPPAIGRRAA